MNKEYLTRDEVIGETYYTVKRLEEAVGELGKMVENGHSVLLKDILALFDKIAGLEEKVARLEEKISHVECVGGENKPAEAMESEEKQERQRPKLLKTIEFPKWF